MAQTPIEAAFIALLAVIEEESEKLQSNIRECIAQADLPAAQHYQDKLKRLLSFRANLIKAYRKWRGD